MKLYSNHFKTDAGSKGEGDSGGKLLVEMNTTPLIDVMLVLLVMLIITIPTQLHSVNLDLPSAQTQQEPEVVRLQIDSQGFVRWNNELITETSVLDTKLLEAARANKQPEIHVSPTPDTPYALVAGMLAIAQRAGLRQVGVVN